MSTIAASNAVVADRILPQHQAALTLIQGRLSAPGEAVCQWLDLACGRGQILRHLDKNLSDAARGKIDFYAYDLDHNYGRETQQLAETLSFKGASFEVGTLANFDKLLDARLTFDFITLTNTVHEVAPGSVARLLANCIKRLSSTGTLFIYDMEKILPPELGAVPWSRDEIRSIVFQMLDSVGAPSYRPEIGQWHHTTCNGWNVQLDRRHIGKSQDELEGLLPEAVRSAGRHVETLLAKKRDICVASLEALTAYGPETADEQRDQGQLLHEFWATSRALEGRK